MIRRFALLSLMLHASLAVLLIDRADSRRLFPAPELTVALSHTAERSTVQSADTIVHPATARTSEQGFSTAMDVGPTEKAQDDNTADTGNGQRRNHLQAQLRAAFEAQFVYPPLARRHGWQGRVRIALRIEPNGRFSELRVLRSSGYAVLDQNALQTLEHINRIDSARPWLDGRPVQLELPIVYRLTKI